MICNIVNSAQLKVLKNLIQKKNQNENIGIGYLNGIICLKSIQIRKAYKRGEQSRFHKITMVVMILSFIYGYHLTHPNIYI